MKRKSIGFIIFKNSFVHFRAQQKDETNWNTKLSFCFFCIKRSYLQNFKTNINFNGPYDFLKMETLQPHVCIRVHPKML